MQYHRNNRRKYLLLYPVIFVVKYRKKILYVSISQIVRRIKQQTTLAVWQNYEDFLRRHFWREKTFWSDGYFASSVGNASIDTVRQYIQNQG